jgi:hypothetical protein
LFKKYGGKPKNQMIINFLKKFNEINKIPKLLSQNEVFITQPKISTTRPRIRNIIIPLKPINKNLLRYFFIKTSYLIRYADTK